MQLLYGPGQLDVPRLLRKALILTSDCSPRLSRGNVCCTARLSLRGMCLSDRSILKSKSSITLRTFGQTPVSCHSLSRRQQVIPLPHASSGGRADQGQPVCSTKRTPVKTSRFAIRGRPAFGRGGREARMDSTRFQSASGTNGFLTISC